MTTRDELRAWLDAQRSVGSDEPLSGTLALAALVRDLIARIEALEKPAKKTKAND